VGEAAISSLCENRICEEGRTFSDSCRLDGHFSRGGLPLSSRIPEFPLPGGGEIIGTLDPGEETTRRLERDHRRYAEKDPPFPVEDFWRAEYGTDLTASFGSVPLRHPFGKASGQLSLNEAQVRADAHTGLAFSVLKTVIAEGPAGASRMAAWKVKASRMACERITSRSGKAGWTISWIGRGWEGSLASYASFLEGALRAAAGTGLEIVASAKFHLTGDGESYDEAEYAHTIRALAEAWRRGGGRGPLLLEKDFSPTLAGSDRSREEEAILRWIDDVPRLVRAGAPGPIRLGLKLMNALFDDGFQVAMLRKACRVDPPLEFITCFNRLFDPERKADGHAGIAFGGFDLSDRNLRVLTEVAREGVGGPPISATGNITSGRMMAEYALRGATSGQIHTYFQVPRESYLSKRPRSRAALHELIYNPREGLIAALAHIRRRVLGAPEGSLIRFLDLPAIGRDLLRDSPLL
jgi:hypothetical protein